MELIINSVGCRNHYSSTMNLYRNLRLSITLFDSDCMYEESIADGTLSIDRIDT